MPRDQAEAIVLRASPVGDQDRLVVFLTRERGLLRGVAKGARKFGSRFGSALEPMTHVDVFFYEKERRDLVTISACDLRQSFFDVQKNVEAALTLAYLAELVEESVPGRVHDDLLFRLLLSVLEALRDTLDTALLARYFEAWFLQIHGIYPDLRRCRRCRREIAEAEAGWLAPGRDGVYCDGCAPARKDEIKPPLARFVAWARRNPPAACPEAPFTKEELRDVGRVLQAMIVHHLEREPKSLRFVR
ncbi:MAG: DNA repair protein RecO [Candidatus Aminicenantes bacterium]|nr:DNA repair protein RecO [Candidatus Aminicenantes bacterium]